MYFLLVLFWIILNGRFTLEILILGLLFAAVVYVFACKFLGLSWEKERKLWKKSLWIAEYGLILLREILVANVTVLKIALTPGRKPHPVLVSFPSPLKKEALKVVLADSITLTPGTITVGLNDRGFFVHCLDESLAKGLSDGVFVQHLKKWEEL